MAPNSARRPAGRLETEVLTALWSSSEPMTPREVQAVLTGDPAYTTVLTTLQRLHAKGQAEREARGKAHVYRPTRDAARNAADHMHSLLGDGTGREIVLNYFVENLSSDEEELLRNLLSDRKDGPVDS